MRRIRAACAVAVSVLSVSSFGTITAMAATQAQNQSLYTTQTQEVNTHSAGDIAQSQTSTMSSQQTQITKKQSPSQQVVNTNQSYMNSTQDHTVTGNGNYSQNQTNQASSAMNKTVTDGSVQITTTTQSDSNQSSSVHSDGTFDVKQTDTSVILGAQSQTEQEQSANTPDGTYDYRSTTQSADDADQVIVGYGVFDARGHLLSDSYGGIPNTVNNSTNHYDLFTPGTKTTVYVAAVNALGKPVINQNAVTVNLYSSNSSSNFETPDTMADIESIQIPAGAFGVPVIYVNTGNTSSYDILDAVVLRHVVRHSPSNPVVLLPTVEATSQTQSATVADTSAQQSQATVVKSDTSQQSYTPIQQTTELTQNTNATQDQSVSAADDSQLHQNQTSAVSTQQSSTNQNTTGPSASVDVTQTESASSQQPVQLSQSQAVTVIGSLINVILSQLHSADPSSGITLSESIDVNVPVAGNSGSGTVVNVTYQGTQHQYTLNTNGPVTLNESQSVDTAKSADVSESASIDYTVGNTQYHIPLAK